MDSNIHYYNKLEKIFEDIAHLNSIADLSQWYYTTFMPPASAHSRQLDNAVLDKTINNLKTSPEVKELIDKSLDELENLNAWQKANLNLIKKEFDEIKLIPENLNQEYIESTAKCEFLWRTARQNNDFKVLSPHLDKVFSLSREIASIKSEHYGISSYNYLIDKFDPDRKIEDVRPIFDKTKDFLANFIPKVIDIQSSQTILPIKEKIDINTQKAIEYKIMEKMGFDISRGRLDESAHPFSCGNKDDVRLTTKYFEDNFLISTFSVIHEAGHGLYSQNLPEKYKYQPVGEYKGYTFHESQSLIMEKQIGTSMSFLECYSKILRDDFGFKGQEYTAENLFKILNKVNPSFIRIDSDEVTYPLHIILRTEIEEKIINNEISAVDLPEIWNQKMEDYLGISPKTISEGCLQDIHWPSGLIGYFPSYYLGSVIASMLLNRITKTYNNIESDISNGNFTKVNQYLNDNLRRMGCSLSSKDLLKQSTGKEELDLDAHFNYLKGKYL